MVENKKPSNKNNAKLFGLSSLYGVARGIVGFPLEQPLESIKTQWQAQPGYKNEWKIGRQIYQTKGFFQGFYAGSLPNLGRVLFKNVYRYPLMVGLPNFYATHLPLPIRENKKAQKLFTGISIALAEGLLLCPFERLKTFFMTVNAQHGQQPTPETFKGYYRQSKNLLADLYRGVGGLVARQTVAWVYFLQADLFMKQHLRRLHSIPESESIPTRHLIPASAGIAVLSTIIIMPFDNLKTRQQLHGRDQQKYSAIVKNIYREAGIRGFFVGWRLRFALYLLHAGMTVDVLERLEALSRKLRGE